MTNEALGYSDELESYRQQENLSDFEVGRVVAEHKERYALKTADAEYDAELIGNLRFLAESRYDLPAVGDWVAFSEYDEGKALIHAIYPRHSIIERQAVGKATGIQIIATNIDFGLLVQAVDRDFNLNRLERYLTICHAAKVQAIIVLSKIDLIDEDQLTELKKQIANRIQEVRVITVSSQTKGYDELKNILEKGKTYCLLGSSGVGKSTLLNHLSGEELMKTGAISTSVKKGRHITSHRELIVLPAGGILIDNPGMREVGLSDVAAGLETTFENILDYASQCKYKDCSHQHEKGCAILTALEQGEIEEAAYQNFLKMEREKDHYEANTFERRKKDKAFGKMIKHSLKMKKKNRQ